MQKTFYLFLLTILLNGCVESVALIGSSVGGASSGRLVQSTIQSTLSYGIKQQTGKTPLGHALAYAEKNNPERKKETCISFVEKTRSEFCTIAKNKISLTNRAVKEKITSTVKKIPKTKDLALPKIAIKTKNEVILKKLSYVNRFDQSEKSPRKLAILFQTEMKNLKEKLSKKYLVSR
tara:strand:+ start:359 stop:892 length:534 start_codon:yes stop_codon:yes gene_type:complete